MEFNFERVLKINCPDLFGKTPISVPADCVMESNGMNFLKVNYSLAHCRALFTTRQLRKDWHGHRLMANSTLIQTLMDMKDDTIKDKSNQANETLSARESNDDDPCQRTIQRMIAKQIKTMDQIIEIVPPSYDDIDDIPQTMKLLTKTTLLSGVKEYALWVELTEKNIMYLRNVISKQIEEGDAHNGRGRLKYQKVHNELDVHHGEPSACDSEPSEDNTTPVKAGSHIEGELESALEINGDADHVGNTKRANLFDFFEKKKKPT